MNSSFDQDIQNINIEESVKGSYLDYSMSVIVGRALPDVRDGLKPVHRRILHVMNELNLSQRSPFKKSARIVGDVIGKYHPHGDTAVYDALVRMAQPFSMRQTLVDGQGNFGSIDGDNAAAMRYTEARMTRYAEELLKDIDKETVDFIPNYDDSMKEPEVLPTRIPNLLVNGSSGIAVGMATNIPPHNLDEVLNATKHLLQNPTATLPEIMEYIQAPDFPTGGTIYGKKGIIDAYTTGRGRIKIRAKTHLEKKGNKDIIIIDELPYQVNKSRLIENIASLVRDKSIEGISEIRDESDREGIRVVIELKRDAMSEIVLNNLFKSTNLETTFGIILLAIKNQEPKVFTLIELLKYFINHRKTVIIRRTIFELEKAQARAHILEGLKKALDHIDEIIALIKASANKEEARNKLVETFEFTEIQASAILDMQLHKLTGLEREKIENELAELLKLIDYLNSILKSEDVLKGIIVDEIDEISEKYASSRQTSIEDNYDDIDIEDLIPNEPMVVTISHRGYIKRVPLTSYERQRRGGKGKTAVTVYDDDFIEDFFTCNTHDTLLFITDKGQLHWLKVYRIPEGSRTAKGKAVVNLINLDPDEKIRAIIPTTDFDTSKSLAFFTQNGVVKRTNLNEFSNIRSSGVRAIKLDDDDQLVSASIVTEDVRWLFVVTLKGACIRFEVDQARQMGRTARGVTAIKFKHEGDMVVGAEIIKREDQEVLMVSQRGIGKRTEVAEYRDQSRGGKGVISMKLTAKTGDVVGVIMVDEQQDLMALTSKGKMIRTDMQTIRKAGRNTSGVIVVNVDKGDKVIDVATAPKKEEDKEEEQEEE
jgi:DNA gyrase subunit A